MNMIFAYLEYGDMVERCYNDIMRDYPLEDDECIAFAEWLEMNHIPHAHIANESRSSGRNAIIRGAKLKKMGQSRGVWDYEIWIPQPSLVDEEIDDYQLVKIEMKRQKGGTLTPEQKEWQKIYETAGIPCKVCHGAEEAVDFVKSLMYH